MLSYQSLMPGGAGTLRYENGCPSLEAFGCHSCRPSTSPGFPPRIGVRGRLFAENRIQGDRSCGLVRRICTADSATPHADPSGGQAPRLAKSSTALHFLIPPSTMGLQFGRVRRWRAGIGVEWRAHPGSESGTCFRTDCPCRVVPEQVATISVAIHVPVGHERDNLLSECCFEFLAALLASSSTGERRLFQPTANGRLIVQPLLHIILAWPRAWRVRWERQTNREGPGVSATRWSPMRGTSRVCNSLRVGLQA